MEPTVVRYEPFGILIWSPKLKCYVTPNDGLFSEFLKDSEANRNIEQLINTKPCSFQRDISKIGLSSTPRKVYTQSKESAPLDAYFDYTANCNQSCSYCYNKEWKSTDSLSEARIQHTIKQLWLNGIMRLHLAGGEPVLYPKKLEAYLNSANNLGMLVSINTNGTLLTPGICETIFTNSVASLSISIDSCTPSVHDSYRINGAGNHSQTISGLRTAIKVSQNMNTKTRICIKTVWNAFTPIDEFEGIIRLSRRLGVTNVKFSSPQKYFSADKQIYLSKEYVDSYYKRILVVEQLKDKYRNEIAIENTNSPILKNCKPIGIIGKMGCIGGQELISIRPNGDLTPCSMNNVPLGNLFTTYQGMLSSFINSNQRHGYIKRTSSFITTECKNCHYFSDCRGGSSCRQNNDSESYGRDPLCVLKTQFHQDIVQKSSAYSSTLSHFDIIYIKHSL